MDKTEFDVVVVGTGLTESIVASALSRAGKSVLHLDAAPYYGSAWATLSFKQISTFKSSFDVGSEPSSAFSGQQTDLCVPSPLQEEQEVQMQSVSVVPQDFDWISNVEYELTQTTSPDADAIEGATPNSVLEDLAKQSRHFNIDLSPKLIMARGAFVRLLIDSDVGRYLEFKNLEGIYLHSDGKFLQVPTSQDSIFSSSFITNPERLALRKFMKFCMEYSSSDEAQKLEDSVANSTFVKFLETFRLSKRLCEFICYSIALLEENQESHPAITTDVLPKIQFFINSIGVYGPTPYLVPLYGTGELPQAFCRLSAIYGGVYMLHHWPTSIFVPQTSEDEKVLHILTNEGIKLKAKYYIGSSPYLSEYLNRDKKTTFSRCICITDRSIVSSQEMVVASLPPNRCGNVRPVRLNQCGSNSSNAPKGKYVLYFSTLSSSSNAVLDLKSSVDYITTTVEDDSTKPRRLWSMFFTQTSYHELVEHCPGNVFLTPDPVGDIDPSFAVRDAKSIFEKICPDTDFLVKQIEQEICPEDTEDYIDAMSLAKLQQELDRASAAKLSVSAPAGEAVPQTETISAPQEGTKEENIKETPSNREVDTGSQGDAQAVDAEKTEN